MIDEKQSSSVTNYYWFRFFVHDVKGHALQNPVHCFSSTDKCSGNLYPDERELWKMSKLQSHDGVVSRRPHIVHGEENKQSSESKQGKTNLTKQNWWNGKRERPGDLIWSAVITVYNAIFANGLKIQMKTLSHYLRLLGCAYVWVRERTHVCECVCSP